MNIQVLKYPICLSTPNQLPAYWEKTKAEASADGFELHAISKGDHEWQPLFDCLETRGDWLGKGRDVREAETYDCLRMVRAWRVENPLLFRKYRAAQGKIEKDLGRLREAKPEVHVPALAGVELDRATWHLPGSTRELRRDLNETYFMHGTSPDVLLDLLAGGLNERFSTVAAFGNGNYLAEDAGKNDQYVSHDPRGGAYPELHARIYSASAPHPDEKVYYLLVCRTTMGAFVRTTTKLTPGGVDARNLRSLDNPSEKIFPHNTRELGPIAGIKPSVLHHGLVVEREDKDAHPKSNLRYREFLVFHGDYAYPEYLIAYQRL